MKTFHGSKRPGGTQGTPVAVLAGQAAPAITIRVPRGAVIAGTVRDQFGTPMSSAQVSVKQAVVANGRLLVRNLREMAAFDIRPR